MLRAAANDELDGHARKESVRIVAACIKRNAIRPRRRRIVMRYVIHLLSPPRKLPSLPGRGRGRVKAFKLSLTLAIRFLDELSGETSDQRQAAVARFDIVAARKSAQS